MTTRWHLYLTAGHAKEAAQVLENCTQNAPHGPECFNEYGRALIGLGDRKADAAACTGDERYAF